MDSFNFLPYSIPVISLISISIDRTFHYLNHGLINYKKPRNVVVCVRTDSIKSQELHTRFNILTVVWVTLADSH